MADQKCPGAVVEREVDMPRVVKYLESRLYKVANRRVKRQFGDTLPDAAEACGLELNARQIECKLASINPSHVTLPPETGVALTAAVESIMAHVMDHIIANGDAWIDADLAGREAHRASVMEEAEAWKKSDNPPTEEQYDQFIHDSMFDLKGLPEHKDRSTLLSVIAKHGIDDLCRNSNFPSMYRYRSTDTQRLMRFHAEDFSQYVNIPAEEVSARMARRRRAVGTLDRYLKKTVPAKGPVGVLTVETGTKLDRMITTNRLDYVETTPTP